MTNFPNGLMSFGIPMLPGMPPLFGGNSKSIFCDPANGSDDYNGLSLKKPVKTLYKALLLAVAGRNDVVWLISNGATTSTARLSLANAVSVDPTATVGTLVWNKASTHLIGVCAGGSISQRARIAPVTTGTRAAIFNSGNFVSVTAQGCLFANFSVFCGFATGGTSQIAWTDSGGRNNYVNVNIQGKGDAESAADTGSRALLITGNVGENTFRGCTIGLDTIKGVDAATEVEFAANSPRNRFYGCHFEAYAGGTSATWLTIGASGIDRYVLFDACTFSNPVLPASAAAASQMTVGASVNAAAGGTVHLRDPFYYGAATMSTSALVFSNLPAANAKGGLGVVAA